MANNSVNSIPALFEGTELIQWWYGATVLYSVPGPLHMDWRGVGDRSRFSVCVCVFALILRYLFLHLYHHLYLCYHLV